MRITEWGKNWEVIELMEIKTNYIGRGREQENAGEEGGNGG